MFIPSIQSYTLQQTNANMVGEKMKVYPLSMKTPKDFHSYASLLEGTYIYIYIPCGYLRVCCGKPPFQ